MANLLDGIDVQLNEDYLEDRAKWDALADKVVYTGAIDAFFDYTLGNLEYRSIRFENEVLNIPNFQGNAAVNYTDRETPMPGIPYKALHSSHHLLDNTARLPASIPKNIPGL